NLICDKSLNISYHQGNVVVDKQTVQQACEEVMQFQADIYQQDKKERRTFRWPAWGSVTVGLIAALSTGWAVVNYMPAQATSVLTQVTE
ncbi:general secretion pathway protein GspA, partial [Vibrio parahaemolyticus]|nr:general secretion pathway protein GspA [Vibrio parahaemolyticus]